ncbi:MAG TPA: aspartyl/asparaginyl beta-hydroxylase domain-containing protein [Rhizomicrobium sp.]
MTFPDRLRLPFDFEPGPLRADLAGLAGESWTEHFVTQNYEGDWSVLPLRAPAGETHPVRQIYPDPSAKEFVDTPLLARCANIAKALRRFACPLLAARLMRLTPGSVIKEHCDLDLDAEHGAARIHVPITTNPDVTFEINRRAVALAPGSVWYLRLSDPHRVANRGASDRVHLVIDATVNDWLTDLLHRAAEQINP